MDKITIIYEDNHLLVVEKPPGMLTQGDISRDADLLSLLKQDIKKRYNKPGNVFLGMVHRLDRPVGGVMVFAKTSKAASRLSDSIRKKEFEKTYLAVIYGVPEPLSGTMRHFLQKDNKTNIVRVVPDSSGKGREAVLNYRTISFSGGLSLVEIELITGRPHQVRVQFASMGFPLYGDARYGLKHDIKGEKNKGGIALWSHKLTFKHPTRDEILTFKSYPPNFYPWTIFELNQLLRYSNQQ